MDNRILNRPMFNWGGPVKQGIMHGIREPYKHGGLSKQFNTGLVGDDHGFSTLFFYYRKDSIHEIDWKKEQLYIIL